MTRLQLLRRLPPVRGAVAQQGQHDRQAHAQHEAVAEEVHREDPEPLAAADRLVDVEGDCLVLGFFERVPDEEIAHGVGAEQAADLDVGEDQFGQGRREVFERGRHGQVGLGRQQALTGLEPPLHPLVLLGGVAELVEAVVEDAMLTPVHGLLADEAGHLALERRIADPVSIVTHRAHEVVLAVGEDGGQRDDHVAGDQVAVLGEMLGQLPHRLFEVHPARRDLFVGVAGLRTRLRDPIPDRFFRGGLTHTHFSVCLPLG